MITFIAVCFFMVLFLCVYCYIYYIVMHKKEKRNG